MRGSQLLHGLLASAALSLVAAAPAGARTAIDIDDTGAGGHGGAGGGGHLQCVPYARQISGIHIFGDAHSWWGQADGRYARGKNPRVGAVMALRPHGNSRLGHVAAVSRIVDSRTVLIRHANWSAPGRIEDNVRAVDVSPGNDWSQVRVWYGPAQALGSNRWPVYGFIYNEKPGKPEKAGREKAASTPKQRSTDPIGDIIAGRLG